MAETRANIGMIDIFKNAKIITQSLSKWTVVLYK